VDSAIGSGSEESGCALLKATGSLESEGWNQNCMYAEKIADMTNMAHCSTWIAVPQSALRLVFSVEKILEVMRRASSVVVVENAAASARAVENQRRACVDV